MRGMQPRRRRPDRHERAGLIDRLLDAERNLNSLGHIASLGAGLRRLGYSACLVEPLNDSRIKALIAISVVWASMRSASLRSAMHAQVSVDCQSAAGVAPRGRSWKL
jgi:hypothetical protein